MKDDYRKDLYIEAMLNELETTCKYLYEHKNGTLGFEYFSGRKDATNYLITTFYDLYGNKIQNPQLKERLKNIRDNGLK